MNDYTIVRMHRMESGTKGFLPKDPRRCRYYIQANSLDEMATIASKRWPNEPSISFVLLETKVDIPIRFPEEPEKKVKANAKSN